MNSCTAALDPMSMPLVGSSRIMTLGCGREPLGDNDLLLVAARQIADRCIQRCGAQIKPLGVFACQFEFLGQLQKTLVRCSRQGRKGHVLKDRKVADDGALFAAILGHIDDAVGLTASAGELIVALCRRS